MRTSMNTMNHIVIFSHGFGVRKDGRGLLSDIAAGIPEVRSVLFDYNDYDSEQNTLTIYPFSDNVKRLAEVIAAERESDPKATIDIITHSQGAIIDALLCPTNIRKTIFLAPPLSMNIESSLARYRSVHGAKIDFTSVSKLPRSDGSTTLVPPEYWKEREECDEPITLYNTVAEQGELTIISANQDTVLSETSLVGLSPHVVRKGIDGDHDFGGPARQPLIYAIRSILV